MWAAREGEEDAIGSRRRRGDVRAFEIEFDVDAIVILFAHSFRGDGFFHC